MYVECLVLLQIIECDNYFQLLVNVYQYIQIFVYVDNVKSKVFKMNKEKNREVNLKIMSINSFFNFRLFMKYE